MGMLPEAIKPSLQGAVAGVITTLDKDQTPNATFVSQVWFVDDDHVALSLQFFNKTARNVRENPRVALMVLDPTTFIHWHIEADFQRSESEGPTYDEMAMQLEVIASMSGMTGVFHLQAADIYKVRAVRSYSPFT